MTAFYSPYSIFPDIFWWISACLNNPFYTKGATGNFQIYQGVPFSAVPPGEAVLEAQTPAKAGTGFRLGESSMKLPMIKEEAK